jgi:hypothetical protein
VIFLERLARAFERWTEPPAPVCPWCQAPMVLRREEPVGYPPAALERVHACERCSHLTSSCMPWAIPD